MSALSIGNSSGDSNVNNNLQPEDEETAVLGFGGYSWQQQAMWANPGELMRAEDFDLSAIPPIEIGTTCDMNNNQQYDPITGEGEYNDTTPGGNDPFASLFSYDGMNW